MQPSAPYGPPGQNSQFGGPASTSPQTYRPVVFPGGPTPSAPGAYGSAYQPPATNGNQYQYQYGTNGPAAPYGPPPAAQQPFYGYTAPGMGGPINRAALMPSSNQAMPAQHPYVWQLPSSAVQPSVYPAQGYSAPPAVGQYRPNSQASQVNQTTQYTQYQQPQAQAPQMPRQMPPQVPAQPQYAGYGQPYQNRFADATYNASPRRRGRLSLLDILRAKKPVFMAGGVMAGAVLCMVGITALVNSGGSTPSSNVIKVGGTHSTETQDVSPEQLFQTALNNAMQTKSYNQTVDDRDQKLERKVDVSNVRSPQVAGTIKSANGSGELDIATYATLNDTLLKINAGDTLRTKPTAKGQWIQVRRAGVMLDAAGTGGSAYDGLFSPNTAIYNNVIFGNYNQTDRSALLAIINEQIVYRYDPAAVTTGTAGGQEVIQYKVTISSSGQRALAAKAAQLAGVDQKRIDEAATIAQLSGNANDQVVISVSTRDQRVVQLKDSTTDNPRTATYGGINLTQLPVPPRAQLSWDQL